MNGFWKSWSNKNFVSKYKDNEITLFWTHHETQLNRQRGRKTKDNMVRQHHSMDKMDLERVLRATDNRSQWKTTIHGAVNPWIEDD